MATKKTVKKVTKKENVEKLFQAYKNTIRSLSNTIDIQEKELLSMENKYTFLCLGAIVFGVLIGLCF